MVEKAYQVVWTKRSQQQLNAAYQYICLYSQKNALHVIEDIVTSLNKAVINPEFYAT